MLGRGRGLPPKGPGSRGETGRPSAGFPPVRVAAGAGREPGASAVQTRLAGGRGHVWAGADIDPAATITDACLPTLLFTTFIYVVKVRPARPRFQAPFPGVGGAQTSAFLL